MLRLHCTVDIGSAAHYAVVSLHVNETTSIIRIYLQFKTQTHIDYESST